MSELNGKQPTFGTVRYNSSTPIETRFGVLIQKERHPSVINFSKRDLLTQNINQPVLLSDEDKKLEIKPLPYGGDGIQVVLQGSEEKWIFDFAAPIGKELTPGKYETSYRYPFHTYTEAGIGIEKSRAYTAMPFGYFEVIDIKKSTNGAIKDIELNFSIETEDGEIYQGTIRYSDPVVLIEDDIYFSDEDFDFDDDDCEEQ